MRNELPKLSDSEAKHLISKYKKVHPQSPEGEKLAQQIADRAGPNVGLEMVKLAGKRTFLPFLPPGPTWEASFFWTRHPYESHAGNVIRKIHGPGAETALRTLVSHGLLRNDAILGLWAIRANLSPDELQVLFPQTYLRDWEDLIPVVEHLPKDDAAHILLTYVTPGLVGDTMRTNSDSIAELFDCQAHPPLHNHRADAHDFAPLSDTQFKRLRRVLMALKNLHEPAADACLSGRRPWLESAMKLMEQARAKMLAESSPIYPIPEDKGQAEKQLSILISDIRGQ